MGSELYNYIKNELAKGKTKDQISENLLQNGGWSQEDINQAFSNLRKGDTFIALNNLSPRKSKGFKIIVAVIAALAFFGIYLTISGLQWRKEVRYRQLMAEVLPEAGAVFKQLNDAIENVSGDAEFIELCPKIERSYSNVVKKLATAKIPEKYKKSHTYMREGIKDQSAGASTMCKGFLTKSKETLASGIEMQMRGLAKIEEGQKRLEIEAKNKSFFERLMTK